MISNSMLPGATKGKGRAGPGRHTARPNGAYKLLALMLYGTYASCMVITGSRYTVTSLAKLGRILGTESKKIRAWLEWLEQQGYLTALEISPGRRRAVFRVRRPANLSRTVE